MQFYGLSQWFLFILPIIFAIIPWTSARNIGPSIRSFDTSFLFDDATGNVDDSLDHTRISSLDKRTSGGHDPYGLCGDMSSMDCFYVYLEAYANLLASMEGNRSSDSRNIGKRSDMEFKSLESSPYW